MSKNDVVSKFAHVAEAEEIFNETVKDLREELVPRMWNRSLPQEENLIVGVAYAGVCFANAIARHGPDHVIARKMRLRLRSAITCYSDPPPLVRQRTEVPAVRPKKRGRPRS